MAAIKALGLINESNPLSLLIFVFFLVLMEKTSAARSRGIPSWYQLAFGYP